MNAAALLKSLLAMVEPVGLKEFDQAAIPELQSLIDTKVNSPDLKVILGSLLATLKVVGDAEIPKA